MTRVSAIAPVYDARPCLEACVDFVLAKTHHDVEAVLVDEGATDGSGDWFDTYRPAHENVLVMHQENGRLSTARNAGLDTATNEYEHFLDSDDRMAEASVANPLACAEEVQAQVVVASHYVDVRDEQENLVSNETRLPPRLRVDVGSHEPASGSPELLDHIRYAWNKLCRWTALAPDVVRTLDESMLGADRNGVFFALRSDLQQALTPHQRRVLMVSISDYGAVVKRETHRGDGQLDAERAEDQLPAFWAWCRRARLVVTGRQHGKIFALITGSPSLALDIANHNLSQCYTDWLVDLPGVELVDEIVAKNLERRLFSGAGVAANGTESDGLSAVREAFTAVLAGIVNNESRS